MNDRVPKVQYIRSTAVANVTTTEEIQVAGFQAMRQWLLVECVLSTGIPLAVLWGSGPVSVTWGYAILQPGEKLVFSKTGDMPWNGPVHVLGVGGTASYRSCEVYTKD